MTTVTMADGHDTVAETIANESNQSFADKESSTKEAENNGERAKTVFNKLGSLSHSVIGNTGKAIGNLLPVGSLQAITQPKFSMPDKTVASQVLMYRQLLHTACRPGLRLSRAYQGTKAQKVCPES